MRARGSKEGAGTVALLGGTTALLLLCVFTVVNIAVLTLRKDHVGHRHFIAPSVLPIVGAISCAFLAGPWARSEAQQEQYKIAGYLLALGVILWALTWIANRGFFFARPTCATPRTSTSTWTPPTRSDRISLAGGLAAC